MPNTNTKPIKYFCYANRFLSNFFEVAIERNGIPFRSAEHAYQAAKTDDPKELKQVQEASTPGQAKRLGRYLTLRPHWEDLKCGVMLELLRQKFDPALHPDLVQMLMDTGDADLIENNNWGDRYWGVSGGTGFNTLGKLLMQVRTELQGTVLNPKKLAAARKAAPYSTDRYHN
jgi:ribA/ribD-fused uncharacterized protein